MKNKTYNKKKMLVVFSIAVVLIVSLMARLFYLMVFDAEHYQKLAKDLHERERKIKAARGEILDRNGVVLAANKTVCTISVIHSQVTEPEKELTKEEVLRNAIVKALRKHNGRRKEAAKDLFISERTLYRKIKELGINEY